MKFPLPQKIFITGACGFVGKFLVNKLLDQGSYEVVANCHSNKHHFNTPKLRMKALDLSDPKMLDGFFRKEKIDVVIHLSAMARIAAGESAPDEAFRTNVEGTRNVLTAAGQSGVRRFIFISSDLVRNHKSVVGITKLISESEIIEDKNSEMEKIVLRLPNISWTPGSVHLIFERLIREGKPITITHPEMSRRFISGTEAASYISHLVEEGNRRAVYVVNKKPERIVDLARQMMDEKGTKLDLIEIGMRPGEKLVEEVYGDHEVQHTGFLDLALLIDNIPNAEKKEDALRELRSKMDFELFDKVVN